MLEGKQNCGVMESDHVGTILDKGGAGMGVGVSEVLES